MSACNDAAPDGRLCTLPANHGGAHRSGDSVWGDAVLAELERAPTGPKPPPPDPERMRQAVAKHGLPGRAGEAVVAWAEKRSMADWSTWSVDALGALRRGGVPVSAPADQYRGDDRLLLRDGDADSLRAFLQRASEWRPGDPIPHDDNWLNRTLADPETRDAYIKETMASYRDELLRTVTAWRDADRKRISKEPPTRMHGLRKSVEAYNRMIDLLAAGGTKLPAHDEGLKRNED